MLVLSSKTISSREIAKITGKLHAHILRDCEKLNLIYEKIGESKIGLSSYSVEGQGSKNYTEMLLTKMQCMDLMTGYNAELRIKVNRRWEELENEKQFYIPQTYKEALKLAYEQQEVIEQQELIIQEQQEYIENVKPSLDFLEQVFDSEGLVDIGETAKLLELPFGRNTLFKELRERGIFFKNKNEPKQKYVSEGNFVLKEKVVKKVKTKDVVVKVMVTQKGIYFLNNLFVCLPLLENN